MTAAEATRITADAEPAAVPERVDALLKQWYAAITAAAKANRHQAFERDVSQLRLATTRQDLAAVLARLRADGFTVGNAADGEVVVSWPAGPTAKQPPARPTVEDSPTVLAPEADPSR